MTSMEFFFLKDLRSNSKSEIPSNKIPVGIFVDLWVESVGFCCKPADEHKDLKDIFCRFFFPPCLCPAVRKIR